MHERDVKSSCATLEVSYPISGQVPELNYEAFAMRTATTGAELRGQWSVRRQAGQDFKRRRHATFRFPQVAAQGIAERHMEQQSPC